MVYNFFKRYGPCGFSFFIRTGPRDILFWYSLLTRFEYCKIKHPSTSDQLVIYLRKSRVEFTGGKAISW